MDDQRVPGGAGETLADHAGAPAWRTGGAVRPPGREPFAEALPPAGSAAQQWAYGGDEDVNWTGAGPEPEGDPRYPYHHQSVPDDDDAEPVPGLDDATPPGGTAVVGTPLWHQARHSSGYQHLHPYPPFEPPTDPYHRYEPEEPPTYGPESYGPPGSPVHPQGEAPEGFPTAARDWAEPPEPELPKRVPGEPELPHGVEDVGAEEDGGGGEWTAPELARIADELRRNDVPRNPDNGFDMDEVLAAVRGVAGVRDAWLRADATGVHTLRLDLADDADPAYVSKEVARMLGERMGLTPTPRPVPAGELPGDQPEPPASGRRSRGGADRPEPEADRQAPGPAVVPSPRRSLEPEPVAQAAVAGPERATVAGPERVAPAPSRPAPPPEPTPEPSRPASPEPAPEPARQEPAPNPAVSEPRPTRRARHGGAPAASEADPVAPTAEEVAEAMPRPLPPRDHPGVRVVIDHVQVNMFGLEATVEVRLAAGERRVLGLASGPAVDGYVTRLAAVSAARAIDQLLREMAPDGDGGRCFVEHTGVVPFGTTEVAVVVVQLVCEGWVEQLAGCAVVAGDPRQAVVRATLGAVNRRLEALLT